MGGRAPSPITHPRPGPLLPPLSRKRRLIDRRHDPQGVLVVDLPQHLVGQVEAVEAPESMALAVVGEVLVRRLQGAEVGVVLRGLPDVLAEEYTVLVADEEGAGGSRLAAELVE